MVLVHSKIKASSILEVVVAMVIIVMVLGTSLMIYVKITGSSFNYKKLMAKGALTELVELIKLEKDFSPGDLTKEGLIFEKKISRYQSSNDLILLELEVKDNNGNKLGDYKEIVLVNEE